MYTMYIMYKINDFRKCMRKAFNDASSGHEVVIERYGQLYQLVALVDKPLPGHSFESTPKAVVPITEHGGARGSTVTVTNKSSVEGTQIMPPIITKRNEDMEFCKHGAVKGFCKKGCK